MQCVYTNLSIAMREQDVSVKDLAVLIDKSEEIVCLKLQGIREWTLSEAIAISRYLQYPDFKKLFLR